MQVFQTTWTEPLPNQPGEPLTVEVISALEEAQETAQRIRSCLFSLTDRLFGSPPEEKGSSPTNQIEASNFKECHAERAAMLNRTLNIIGSMASDLANRI